MRRYSRPKGSSANAGNRSQTQKELKVRRKRAEKSKKVKKQSNFFTFSLFIHFYVQVSFGGAELPLIAESTLKMPEPRAAM